MTDATSENAVPGPDTDVDPGAAEAEQFESDLASLQRERDDLLDTTRRLQADFENYRKRVLREQTGLIERSTGGLLEQLLPVLDSFELAVRNLEKGDVDENVRKGIELVYAELSGVVERAGLTRIDAHQTPFNPNEHETIIQNDNDNDPHIAEILHTKWKLKGRVLRPAIMKVTRKTNE